MAPFSDAPSILKYLQLHIVSKIIQIYICQPKWAITQDKTRWSHVRFRTTRLTSYFVHHSQSYVECVWFHVAYWHLSGNAMGHNSIGLLYNFNKNVWLPIVKTDKIIIITWCDLVSDKMRTKKNKYSNWQKLQPHQPHISHISNTMKSPCIAYNVRRCAGQALSRLCTVDALNLLPPPPLISSMRRIYTQNISISFSLTLRVSVSPSNALRGLDRNVAMGNIIKRATATKLHRLITYLLILIRQHGMFIFIYTMIIIWAHTWNACVPLFVFVHCVHVCALLCVRSWFDAEAATGQIMHTNNRRQHTQNKKKKKKRKK